VTQRKLRIEVFDETRHTGELDFETIAEFNIGLPRNLEVPGERLIEAAKLAYRHIVGADLPDPLVARINTRPTGAE
jgi:hypothetical protein